MEVIINSMTKAERAKPELLNGSRRARIAKGAGVTVTDVNQMMKKFNETKKMVKHATAGMEQQASRKGKKDVYKRQADTSPRPSISRVCS